MIIEDLKHLEDVSEENSIEGGKAYADAYAYASASGSYFAQTFTSTVTDAFSTYFFLSR